jgi:hypothetical protein
VITHTGQVLDAAAADEHDRVLLEVVADARDVRGDLDPVGQADAGDLAERGVGLLGGGGVDARAHSPLLRRALEGGGGLLRALLRAAALHELVDRRHR